MVSNYQFQRNDGVFSFCWGQRNLAAALKAGATKVVDLGVVYMFRDRHGFPTWASSGMAPGMWGDLSEEGYEEALAEKIRGEEDDPLPPTLEEAKASFDRCEGHRLGAQYHWATGAELGAWKRDQIPAYEAPVDLHSLHVEVWNRHNLVPVATFRPVAEGNRITGWKETWPGKKS